jgi:hypothetical protein
MSFPCNGNRRGTGCPGPGSFADKPYSQRRTPHDSGGDTHDSCTIDRYALREATPEHILQIGSGFWASKTLLNAVELGVFSALAQAHAIIDDEGRENAFGLLMSLNMLIETTGGFDYTSADCQSWMQEAGFRETRVEHLLGPNSMVIGLK